jgi:beta-N-acetylhexosaminidase
VTTQSSFRQPRTRRRLSLTVSVILSAAALSTLSARGQISQVEYAVSKMTLAEKVGQLVMIRVHGTSLSSTEYALIANEHLGGVILFGDNYSDRSQLRALTARLQKAGRAGNGFGIGMLVSADQEGGAVKRFPDLPPTRSAPAMGRIGSSSIAYDQGSRTGAALHAVGVNMDLAPVLDLSEGPRYIMRSRSFGSSPSRVGRLSSAFMRGVQRYRVAATLKHFPGLGAATINSDNGAAYVYLSSTTIKRSDLVPFDAAIERGATAVMVGHGIYRNAWGRVPGSVNPSIARGLLRTRAGFTGVAISDSLNAIAWRYRGLTSRACVETIKAGVDVALVTGGSSTSRGCADAIYAAAAKGYIPPWRVNEAVRRVLVLKQWLGVWTPGPVPTSSPTTQPTETAVEPSPTPTGSP